MNSGEGEAGIDPETENSAMAHHVPHMDMSSAMLSAKDRFHLQRSEFLDAFAAIEEAVTGLLEVAGLQSNGPLSGKLGALRKLKPGPRYSRDRKSKVEAALASLAPLLAIRADIVHSKLACFKHDGETKACFINAGSTGNPAPLARIVSNSEFKRLTVEARMIAGLLGPTPASSQPRPSPGAAGDP